MAISPEPDSQNQRYVGTLVGESTSQEFRLAVAQQAVREQDIIAVDAELQGPEDGTAPETLRIWAKVQRIERLNPLFPTEAGHELAATQTNPLDTVLSLSREMVTAVCCIIGAESLESDGSGGKLGNLRYPPQPVSTAYLPESDAIGRIVLGDLREDDRRALDVARLSNRSQVPVKVDGHAIVSRHLAILAMTGAGKSWTSRRIIEQLSERHYPIVIFDPHGDYTGLAEVQELRDHVRRYYAQFPVFEEDVGDAQQIIESLSGEEMSSAQSEAFDELFKWFQKVPVDDYSALNELRDALFEVTSNINIQKYPFHRDLFALSYVSEALRTIAQTKNNEDVRKHLASFGIGIAKTVGGQQADTFRVLARQLRKAAFELRKMENINKKLSIGAEPLPADRNQLVEYDRISIISLSGYTEVFKAALYSLISRHLFEARVQQRLPYGYSMVVEEAHNFVPNRSDETSIQRSIAVTKQIAQEGRKFGVGMVLISQRPSRLDETALSQCNSFIVMRMVNPADQNFVRRVIESLGEEEVRLLPDLDVGEAILSGQLVNFPVLAKIEPPASQGEREEQDAFMALEEARKRMSG